jgi:hypothetical protein
VKLSRKSAEVSREFRKSLARVSREFRGDCFAGVSRKFRVSFASRETLVHFRESFSTNLPVELKILCLPTAPANAPVVGGHSDKDNIALPAVFVFG